MIFDDDIPVAVKEDLRALWRRAGLEQTLGIKGRLMAERIIVWAANNPDAAVKVGWDMRMSTRTGRPVAILDTQHGFELMNYARRPYRGRDAGIDRFVQAFYAARSFINEQGLRPETLPLLNSMPRRELAGSRAMAA